MKHPIIKSLLLTGALTAGGIALAGGGHHGFGGKNCHGGGMERLTQLEGITDEQRTQLEALRSERRDAMKGLKSEMRENRKALHQAAKDQAPQETIAPLAEKQGDLVEQMILRRMEMRQKLAAILTAEQMKELKGQRREHRGHKWH